MRGRRLFDGDERKTGALIRVRSHVALPSPRYPQSSLLRFHCLSVIPLLFIRESLKYHPELNIQAVRYELCGQCTELRNALGTLSSSEALYCTDACLRRYLRARNGNLSQAKAMLTQTLSWRSSYKPENIRWEDVAVEFETGKMYKAEFADKLGRPVIIMTPGNQNSNSSEGQIKQLVYAMENALLYLPENQDQFVWIIDYDGWSLSKATPLKTSKEVANILQNHYPERLAVAILLNAPKAFEYVWKLIKPFVDPTTYKKARFVYTHDPKSLNALEDVFDLKSLDLNLRGKYNHAEYACSMRADDLRMKSFAGNANFVPENVMNGQ